MCITVVFYICIFVSCGRRHWEDMSLKLGRAFCIAATTAKLSEDLLRQAKNLHDTLFRYTTTHAPANSSVCLIPLILFCVWLCMCRAIQDMGKRDVGIRTGVRQAGTTRKEDGECAMFYRKQWGHFESRCPQKAKRS